MYRNNVSLQKIAKTYLTSLNRLEKAQKCRLLTTTSSIQNAATLSHNHNYSMDKYFKFSPEEGFIRTSSFDLIQVPNTTIDKYVWKNLKKWQNKIALVCGETGRQYTYAQLRDHCAALAVRLQSKFNLNYGDVIAICLPNIPEFAIASLGAIEAGFIVTSVNPIYTADEIARQLLNSNAKFVIGTVEGHSILTEAIQLTKRPINIMCIKTTEAQPLPAGAIDFFENIQTAGINLSDLKTHPTKGDDLAFLPYSSGTTGLPKGVMLSHNNITTNCEQIQINLPYIPLIYETTSDFQDVTPSVLPFFHIYGFTVCLISKLHLGAKIITLSKFAPDTFMKSIIVHKGTIMHLVPPIILFLAMHPTVEAKHVAGVRSFISGAAPIGGLDADRLLQKAPQADFIQGYGLTETSPVICMNIKQNSKPASIGGPTPLTETKIVAFDDANFTGLGPNQKGEFLTRGPQTMLGYLNNKQATDDIMVTGGWLRTGDVGHYDEDGFFFITDRLKELIKVKGFQVPPAELEEILRDHPKIADAAVVGVDHPKHGEVPWAFVVKRPTIDVTEDEVKEYVASKVAVYKQLDKVIFMDAIPKNTTGKIMRRQLKEKFC